MNSLLIIIYQDPEFFPPTLYAIDKLSDRYDKIYVVGRKYSNQSWLFPKNTELFYCHEKIDIGTLSKISTWKKFMFFMKFFFLSRKLIKKYKPECVLCYDDIGLLSGYLSLFTLNINPKFWFHSHDVIEGERRFSVGWFAKKMQKKAFRKLDLFTLPSLERKKFFPVEELKGNIRFLPNYPPLKENPDSSFLNRGDDELKMIYQGTITPGHGIEEIIHVLSNSGFKRRLKLTLIGPVRKSYKDILLQLAHENNVSEYITMLDPVPFEELRKITEIHHVGLAIHLPKNIIYSTGGTASNKIYEYVASGLPVLLFDNEHYRKHLDKYDWAYFTDLQPDNIVISLKSIISNYDESSKSAFNTYLNKCNYDIYFNDIIMFKDICW